MDDNKPEHLRNTTFLESAPRKKHRWDVYRTKYEFTCPVCNKPVTVGSPITICEDADYKGWVHYGCR